MKLILLSVLGWRWLCWHISDFSCKSNPRCPFCESDRIRRAEKIGLAGEYACEDCECIF